MLMSLSKNRLMSAATKDLYLLRHGQATHNPRAEAARAGGCSFDDFLELMRQDDSLDSELTALGRER
jgi:broad specificity phosphatase PhoE